MTARPPKRVAQLKLVKQKLGLIVDFYVSLCLQIKKQISITGKRHWDCIFVGF